MCKQSLRCGPWLESLGHLASGLSFIPALDAISHSVSNTFQARLRFVKILGRRWSYIAGEVDNEPAQFDIFRIKLSGKIGLVVETWGTLSEEDRERLLVFLKQLASSRESG